MRILFIAQGDSPHTARTLQLTKRHYPDAVFDVFGSSPFPYSPFLNSIAECHENGGGVPPHADLYWSELLIKPVTAFSPKPALLASILRQEKFDFIHVLCMQEAAYILRKALEEPGTSLRGARVIYSIWGNDFYHFRRIPEHREEIIKALPLCDRLHADAERDTHMARALGYTGDMLPVTSAIAAADILQESVNLSVPTIKPPSQRKRLLIRGTSAVRGRSFLALAAFQNLPVSIKQKYQVLLIAAAPIDVSAAFSITESRGVAAMGWVDQGAVLQLLSESRIAVSLNTTDGTPQLFWEAAATHCYPVFSQDTGLAPHVQSLDGKSNIALINPNDIREIAEIMEQALTDDAMVDAAAPHNHALLHKVQSKKRLEELFRETYR